MAEAPLLLLLGLVVEVAVDVEGDVVDGGIGAEGLGDVLHAQAVVFNVVAAIVVAVLGLVSLVSVVSVVNLGDEPPLAR